MRWSTAPSRSPAGTPSAAQLQQAFRRDHLVLELELQRGDQLDQVQVPATLAVSVDGPLDVDAAGLDGGEGVRERQTAVVVRVNTQGRRDAVPHLPDA